MEQHELRRRGPWTREEDDMLRNYVNSNGEGHWDTVARILDFGRSGNSCRLRWVNYLSPLIRRGSFTDEEMLSILQLHYEMGNQWSKIAREIDRTDNDIKNLWNTRFKKEAKRFGCGVESEEFLNKMTAMLRGRIQAAAAAAAVPPFFTTATDHSYSLGTLQTVAGADGGTTTTVVASYSAGPSNHAVDYSDDSLSAQELVNHGSSWSTLDSDGAYLFTPVPAPLAVAGDSGGNAASTSPIVGYPNIGAADSYDDIWCNLDSICTLDDPSSFGRIW